MPSWPNLGRLIYRMRPVVELSPLTQVSFTALEDETQDPISNLRLLGGAIVGSLLAPYISDFKGRRMVIFIGGSLATFGAALQGGAVTVAMLIAGRFIAGLAIGLMSATIPVYCVRRLKLPKILPRPSLTKLFFF